MSTKAIASSHRTQIYLPQDLYALATKAAKQQSISLAKLIRTALENQLVNASKTKGNYDLMDLKGSLKDAPNIPKDFARNIDKYLAEIYKSKT